jgi:hypothetical protein
MNLELMKRNIGQRVQLQPPAIHLDPAGRELPCRDEDWIVAGATDVEIRLDEAQQMGLTTTIGKDGVHHYTSNPSRSTPSGLQYGHLLLTVQMYIQGGQITYRPCSLPGQRVPPPRARVAELRVNTQYPVASGLQRRLQADGYRDAWIAESRLPALELEGWERVVELDRYGMPTCFCVAGGGEKLVYVKTREPDLQVFVNSPYFRQQPGLKTLAVDGVARALVFTFDTPTNALGFLFRASGVPNSPLRYAKEPGRVDTVRATLTEAGRRAMSPSG